MATPRDTGVGPGSAVGAPPPAHWDKRRSSGLYANPGPWARHHPGNTGAPATPLLFRTATDYPGLDELGHQATWAAAGSRQETSAFEALRVANQETELLQAAVLELGKQRLHAHETVSPAIAGDGMSESSSEQGSSEVSMNLLETDDTDKLPPALRHNALCFLPGDSYVRRWLYWVTHRREFEGAVILVILTNSVLLCLDDPKAEEQEAWLQQADLVFTFLFTLELCTKVLASGLVLHPHSYLRSGWNVLDFVIVVLAWLTFLPGVDNYSAVRVLRVLRPLRSINGIPGLKNIVNALFLSVRELFHVLMLVTFFFCVFGILGVQLFMGLFRRRCLPETGPENDTEYEEFCHDGVASEFFQGRPCDPGFVCLDYKNPNHGFVNFDHIGWAFLVIFQCITVEGWVDQMYRLQDLFGAVSLLYFISLVVLGSYFILNLALAVISERFHTVKENQQTEEFWELHRLAVQELSWAHNHLSAVQAAVEAQFQGGGEGGELEKPQASVLLPQAPASPLLLPHPQGESRSAHSASSLLQKPLAFPDGASSGSQAPRSATDDPMPLSRPPSLSRIHRDLAEELEQRILRGGPLAWAVRFRLGLLDTTRHQYFQRSVFVFIIVNTILLAIEHHGQPRALTEFLAVANFLLTGVFTAEMILKMLAMGMMEYVRDSFNILDAVVVIVSLVELALSGSSSVSVFRALRLFRVFKLMKDFHTLRDIIRGIILAVKETGYLNVIILLYLFIAALVGMQLFGGKFSDLGGDEPPRSTFDSFYWSLLTVFQVLTREDWVVPMWDAMRATHPFAAVFFVTLVILGDFIILNLFLAILITSFDAHMPGNAPEEDGDEDGESAEAEGESAPGAAAILQLAHGADGGLVARRVSDPPSLAQPPARGDPRLSGVSSLPEGSRFAGLVTSGPSFGRRSSDLGARTSTAECVPQATPASAALMPLPPQHLPGCDVCLDLPRKSVAQLNCNCWLSNRGVDCADFPHVATGDAVGGAFLTSVIEALQWRLQLPSTNGGRSLCLLGPNNTVRIWLTYVVTHKTFDYVILFCIMFSSLLLAVEDPRDSHPVIEGLNIAFTIIFITELCMKVAAFGLIIGPGAYLKDGWNILDAFVVAVSVLSLVFNSFSIVKVFRALRALRPLRVVNRNLGLKLVVRTLLKAIPGVANVALIASLFYLMFAILGVQLFAGRMHSCSNADIRSRHECVGVDPAYYVQGANTSAEEQTMLRWRANDQNFDNVLQALLTLFEVATLELWVQIMYATIDTAAVDHGPERNHSPLAGMYFMVFIVIGSFFVMNLFVGVVIHNYNIEKRNVEGLNMLSAEQVKWIEMQQLMLTFRPKVKMLDGSLPYRRDRNGRRIKLSRQRRVACALAGSPSFEAAVMAVVLFNIVIMAVDHHGISDKLALALLVCNNACSFLFISEAALKLYAWRFSYFSDWWNRFDFGLVLLACFSVFIQAASASSPVDPTILRIFRIFRVFRILRLVRSSRGIRLLLETLWYSLPYLSNIGLFLGLVFFIYATLGVSLFNNVKRGEFLTRHANFDNFGVALLVLMRVCTGEAWNGIMHDLMVSPPDCEPEKSNCPPTPVVAPMYFISFLIIAAQVMLNLFVAIILDTFSTTLDIEQSSVKMADLNEFVKCWSEFDADASMLLPTCRLPPLLVRLGLPLGFEKMFTRLELMKKAGKYQVPEHGGVVHFVEVLIPLARASMEVELSDREIREQELAWQINFPDLRSLPTLRHRQKRVTVDQFFAASYIAAAYRRSAAINECCLRREDRWVRFKRWRALESSCATQTNDILPFLLDALRALAVEHDPGLSQLCKALGASALDTPAAGEALRLPAPGATPPAAAAETECADRAAAAASPPAPRLLQPPPLRLRGREPGGAAQQRSCSQGGRDHGQHSPRASSSRPSTASGTPPAAAASSEGAGSAAEAAQPQQQPDSAQDFALDATLPARGARHAQPAAQD
eukprot:TRINITY_DN5302_c0_g1_i1.p1 TRINITY_DN5302_c0_g1~~TRINITY_DN5302_c0_g1_i1.p1  ORF type:complete len:1975 (+),score=527.51 TRINITY_DN5302_c0_g1_i1:57-5927(+)